MPPNGPEFRFWQVEKALQGRVTHSQGHFWGVNRFRRCSGSGESYRENELDPNMKKAQGVLVSVFDEGGTGTLSLTIVSSFEEGQDPDRALIRGPCPSGSITARTALSAWVVRVVRVTVRVIAFI